VILHGTIRNDDFYTGRFIGQGAANRVLGWPWAKFVVWTQKMRRKSSTNPCNSGRRGGVYRKLKKTPLSCGAFPHSSLKGVPPPPPIGHKLCSAKNRRYDIVPYEKIFSAVRNANGGMDGTLTISVQRVSGFWSWSLKNSRKIPWKVPHMPTSLDIQA